MAVRIRFKGAVCISDTEYGRILVCKNRSSGSAHQCDYELLLTRAFRDHVRGIYIFTLDREANLCAENIWWDEWGGNSPTLVAAPMYEVKIKGSDSHLSS